MNTKRTKKLYKIGQLTEMLNLTPRTIRYYESFGLLPHIKRSNGKMRMYDNEDVKILKQIRKLQKDDYLPLTVIKERLYGPKISSTTETAIVTDSTFVSPLSSPLSEHVYVIPLTIKIGNSTFKDLKENKAAIQKCLDNLCFKPKITIPSTETLYDFYYSLFKKGYKNIYSIHTSNKLLGLYQNACQAAKKIADKITVMPIDSKNIGGGLNVLITQIDAAIKNKKTISELDIILNKQIPLIFNITLVNSLRHFILGGRMPNDLEREKTNILAALFNFKPILSITEDEGDLTIIECFKMQKTALSYIFELIREEIAARGKAVQTICVSYNYLYGESLKIANQLKEAFPSMNIIIEEAPMSLTCFFGLEFFSISLL